jgi:hypothetical protein
MITHSWPTWPIEFKKLGGIFSGARQRVVNYHYRASIALPIPCLPRSIYYQSTSVPSGQPAILTAILTTEFEGDLHFEALFCNPTALLT